MKAGEGGGKRLLKQVRSRSLLTISFYRGIARKLAFFGRESKTIYVSKSQLDFVIRHQKISVLLNKNIQAELRSPYFPSQSVIAARFRRREYNKVPDLKITFSRYFWGRLNERNMKITFNVKRKNPKRNT